MVLGRAGALLLGEAVLGQVELESAAGADQLGQESRFPKPFVELSWYQAVFESAAMETHRQVASQQHWRLVFL